jgi:hypothetical protein
MKTVDRVFGWLLVVSSLLHGIGSVVALLHVNPDMLVWAESGTLAGLLVAGLNLLRVNRPLDRGLAWVSAGGCVGHLMVAVAFGVRIGNVFDPRPLTHSVVALVLLGFSLRTALGKAAASGAQTGHYTTDQRAILNQP